MKIERLVLKHFRQYRGEQRISFARDSEKNVTIIQGVNGAGKSNLFKAINWCLYGKTDDKGEITSKAAVHDAKKGSTVTTEVQLYFWHQGIKYSLSRSIECLKKDNDSFQNNLNESFTMMRTIPGGKTEKVENKTGEINSILPENVRTYFLFDGEKIDNFSKPESSNDVKYAIHNVLKLEVLQRSKSHLEKVASEFRNELKSIANKELTDLIEKEEKLINDWKLLLNRQTELDDEIAKAKEKIADIDDKLDSIKETSQLQKERVELEQELLVRGKEFEECIVRIRDFSVKSSAIMGENFISKALSIIDTKRIRGEIPSNIRDQFLQDIIERKQCICGRTFGHDSLEHQNLLSLKGKSVSGALEEEVTNLNNSLRTIAARSKFQMQELDKEIKKKIDLVNTIQTLEAQIDELTQKLKGSRLEDVKKLEQQREEFKNDVEKNTLEKGKNVERLKNIDRETHSVRSEIEKAKKDEQRQILLTSRVNLSQNSAEALSKIFNQFADERRREIEEKTREIFGSLIWKESQFKDINLSSAYQLEILDRWKHPASRELSAGERQILSLSFITAMANISGEEAPIVMDTPFTRLSTIHREKIASNIPSLADQLVLFITDEELRGQMEKNLSPRVGERYVLDFDDKTGCTSIQQIEYDK